MRTFAHFNARTVDEAVPMPAIVRVVTGYVKKLFRARVPCTKENIWARDKHRCQYCGNVVTKKDRTLDHVLPKSRGGGRSWENLVTSCVTCNGTKGDRTPEEAGMRLLSTPAAPGKSYRQDRLTWSAIRSSPWAEAIRGSGLLGTE